MEENVKAWGITPQEAALADGCIDKALKAGADKIRVTLNKSMMDLYVLLNGELDKVSHSGDRSICINLFADGKYGAFSTNKLSDADLDDFMAKAVETVKMLAPDEFRQLPAPSRTAKGALTGTELGVFDDQYGTMDSARRLEIAMATTRYAETHPEEYTLVSEEMEYSDSVYETYIVDSNGTKCRHIETAFEVGCEATVEDKEGHKFSGYWWESSPFLSKLNYQRCCEKAIARAAAQIGPKGHRGGKFNMVVENEVASKLINPVLNALNAFSIQQQNSFLVDSLGKKVFSEGLSIMDLPLEKGKSGARMFDSEGVATKNAPIIKDGVISQYFVSTYMAGKMGIEPTIEDATRAAIMPFNREGTVTEGFGAKDMVKILGKGIFVTGFNGGNCNSATGDFSYGVEGFAFSRGRITHPVRGMVITGNFLELWNNLVAAGNDARDGMSKVIPSLAFENVDFSA